MPPPDPPGSVYSRENNQAAGPVQNEAIDVRQIISRVIWGLSQILGLALLGVAVGSLVWLGFTQSGTVETSARVVFSFRGYEQGLYPDTRDQAARDRNLPADRARIFQADDLRAPAIVAEALRNQLLDTSSEFQSRIRGALGIEGIIPANIARERDRLRAAGQNPAPYIPDEYVLTLSLPRSFGLSLPQRERLLNEIVNVYRQTFRRNYGQEPLAFGTAFESLRDADFPEYELVLNTELEQIRAYLLEQIENARSFRSPTTNLSFQDLLEQTDLFSQIRLNEALGLIHQNGLSRNRATAMLKMNYHLRLLEDRERRAIEEERVVRDLLQQTQSRSQNYVLGIKAQAAEPRGTGPMINQGLIDSLLENDSYNFLVREALDAGLAVKAIQAQKARLIDLRDNMDSFVQGSTADQSSIIARAEESLAAMRTAYETLIANIRRTHLDFSRQEYGNAIRLSDEVRTAGILKPLATAGTVGGFIGLALGAGLSLLGVYTGRPRA